MSARLAIWRWSWRRLRMEWRDHVAIAVLITVAVALSAGGGVSIYLATQPNESIAVATQITLSGEPAEVDRFLRALRHYGELAETTALVDGSTERVVVRALDRSNPVVAPLVAVQAGRFPSGPDEVALTPDLAAQLAARVGSRVGLGGLDLQVVGVVENPTDLNDQFVFVDPAEPPFSLETVYLTTRSVGAIDAISFQGGISVAESTPPRTLATLLINVANVVAMLLVGLLATAGFGVVARRRMRQFGLLSAIGASPKQLRTAAAFAGTALGLLAALVGAALGVAGALAVLPRIEGSLGHRVDVEVPLSIVLPAILVATIVSGAAAWLPARALSTQSVTETLASRRPDARPSRSLAIPGALLAVFGFVALAAAVRQQATGLALLAVSAIVVGVLLLTPAAISVAARLAVRGSLPLRIAGRDLARFQSRSAAALGAIALALAIPLGVGLTSAGLDAAELDEPANLDDRSAIVWAPGVLHEAGDSVRVGLDADPDRGLAAVNRVAALGLEPSVAPIDVAIDLTMPVFGDAGGFRGRGSRGVVSTMDCRDSTEGSVDIYADDTGAEICFRSHAVWLANDELAELWDFDQAAIARGEVVAVRATGDYRVLDADHVASGPPSESVGSTVAIPDYASLPGVVTSLDALGDGYGASSAGWLLTFEDPLGPEELAAIRGAIQDGGRLEAFEPPTGNRGLRTVVAMIGAVVGLIVLAATLVLVRSEASDGNRVLAVLGATSGVRRSVAIYTAALLALVGAVLAIPLASVGPIVAGADRERLPLAIPWSTVVIIFVLFPIGAALGSALASARQPSELARTPVR